MYIHHTYLHNHIFTEVMEGLDKKGLVIVDNEFANLFETTTKYNDTHVLVDYDEFRRKGGKLRLVAVN